MLKIDIIAAGRLKKGPYFDLCAEYSKRMDWPVTVHEIESRYKDAREIQNDEHRKIEKLIKDDAFVIVLDGRGKNLSSSEFARAIQKVANEGKSRIQFIIGGADGVGDKIPKRANLVLSLGAQTWPHMLARIMLLEQIYRAQQILKGHPYHRE
jgi:23S rRNA (pseudouridine1915-N3)-methyltransferase